MNRALWNVLIVVLLVAGVAWIWAGRLPAGTAAEASILPPAPAIGHPAPDFTLNTLSGERFDLAGLRGKPVILNFWATWCPPCRSELPELDAASRRYAGQVAVIGVDQAEPAAGVQSFAGSLGLELSDPPGRCGAGQPRLRGAQPAHHLLYRSARA